MSASKTDTPVTPEVKDRLINPRAAYDWSRISNELDEAGLSLSAFRVYFNLLRRSDKHFTCYPGGRRIAEDCGLNRETVIKALHELETRGMLQINRNWGRSSDYEILPLSSWKDKGGNLKYPPEPVGKTDNPCRKNRHKPYPINRIQGNDDDPVRKCTGRSGALCWASPVVVLFGWRCFGRTVRQPVATKPARAGRHCPRVRFRRPSKGKS
jgi:hypothetical protein